MNENEDTETVNNLSFPINPLLSSLVKLTKEAGQINRYEFELNKATNREYSDAISDVSDQLLGLFNQLMITASSITSTTTTIKNDHHLEFTETNQILESVDQIEEVVDNLIELADINLDKATDIAKKYSNPKNHLAQDRRCEDSEVSSRGQKRRMEENSSTRFDTNLTITKPQLKFDQQIDNSNNTLWIPKLVPKYHALMPFDAIDNQLAKRPYTFEIQNINYPQWMFENLAEKLWKPFEDADYTYVKTVEDLTRMLSILETVSEIAVDTEHHDYRTFLGIVCLIQISTRNEDFIVDTLGELRSHLYLLNRVFTNPNILKIFHGAEMDILWLQRDFGVYIVNLFDTFHASNVLELPAHSFQYLLQFYCNVETDKTYQTADWRIRPLTLQMIKYARTDTHYLLYIWDRMRNELLTKSQSGSPDRFINVVLRRSEETALQVFQKPYYDAESGEGPGGWRNALIKSTQRFKSPKHISVFKAIHGWRDHIARVEDESTRYVLPIHMLFNIAERMPMDVPALFGCCNPVPRFIRIHAKKLVELIAHACLEARQEVSERLIAKNESKTQKTPVHIRFESSEESIMDFVNPMEEGKKKSSSDVLPEAKSLSMDMEDALVPAVIAPLFNLPDYNVGINMKNGESYYDDASMHQRADMPVLTRSSALFGVRAKVI